MSDAIRNNLSAGGFIVAGASGLFGADRLLTGIQAQRAATGSAQEARRGAVAGVLDTQRKGESYDGDPGGNARRVDVRHEWRTANHEAHHVLGDADKAVNSLRSANRNLIRGGIGLAGAVALLTGAVLLEP